MRILTVVVLITGASGALFSKAIEHSRPSKLLTAIEYTVPDTRETLTHAGKHLAYEGAKKVDEHARKDEDKRK
jgi:hypothetical protein